MRLCLSFSGTVLSAEFRLGGGRRDTPGEFQGPDVTLDGVPFCSFLFFSTTASNLGCITCQYLSYRRSCSAVESLLSAAPARHKTFCMETSIKISGFALRLSACRIRPLLPQTERTEQ